MDERNIHTIYIYIYTSSIYPALPGQYRPNSYFFFFVLFCFGFFSLPWQPFFEIFSPCFKLGQNVSSCRVSEKSTYWFGRNDGTNIQTDQQTDRQILFPRHATWHKTISGWVSSIPKVWSKSNRGILRNGRT